MGIVNAGQLIVYEDIPADAPRARRRRHLQQTPRRNRATRPAGRDRQGCRRQAGARPHMALGAGGRPPGSRPRSRCRGLHRAGRRGSAPEAGSAAGRDRGAVDGRHEDRRRSLRRRQDVPAAGGQERPRHEEGRRVPPAVHGGGEEEDRNDQSIAGQDCPRHGER